MAIVVQDAILRCIILVQVAQDLRHDIMRLGMTVTMEANLLTAHLEVVMRQGLDLRMMIAVLIKLIPTAPTMVVTAVALMFTVQKKATSPFEPQHLHPLTLDRLTLDDLDLLIDNVFSKPITHIKATTVSTDKVNMDSEVATALEVVQDLHLSGTS
jgi:hypothetical protein